MASRERVLELSRKLMKAKNKSDPEKVLAILETLTSVDMNICLLKETELGKKVNSIRKSELFKNARGIKETAQTLISKWKQLVTTESKCKKLGKHGKPNGIKKLKLRTKSPSMTPPTHNQPLSDNVSTSNGTGNGSVSGFIREAYAWQTEDPRRDKMIQRFIAVLRPEPDQPHYLCHMRLSAEIEAALSTQYGQDSEQYIAKYRDVHFNLKANKDLQMELLLGSIKTTKLVCMTSEEMANKSLKEKRHKDRKWAMEEARCDHALDVSQAMTDEYKCGKCKQRKCKYSQAQTRSADEPMTTFVTCLVCGNRWKC
eukprot:114389_1